ncbi:permease, partial [Bacillus pseudomycoides]
SIAFYPVTLGSLAILVGLLAVNFGARTLGYTAIGFGSFSVLFTLLYPLALSAF